MRALLSGIVAALLLLAVPALAEDAVTGDADTLPALDDAAFDAQFQCPETLPDADARLAEYQRYYAWAKLHHPDWSLKKRVDVRYGLLRRHACAATIAKVEDSARPAFSP